MKVVVRRSLVGILEQKFKALDALDSLEELIDRLRHLDDHDELGLLRPDRLFDSYPLGFKSRGD